MLFCGFERARQPDQKEIRRRAILAAAAALFDRDGVAGTGLTAIAIRAGFTKSNLYRYFESREAVLLTLYLEEAGRFVAAMEAGLAASPVGDQEAIATVIADGFLAHPRFCQLLAVSPTLLEANVSEAVMIPLKQSALVIAERLAEALCRALPSLSARACGVVWSMTTLYLAGLWPAAHPPPSAARVLALPEFQALKPVLARDLRRGIAVILRGVQG